MKGHRVTQKEIPYVSIFRLAEYQCLLEELIKQGKRETITSKDIARLLGYSEEVVRKDLSFVSKEVGRPGSGYSLKNLHSAIARFFGGSEKEAFVFFGSLEAWKGILNFFNPGDYGFKAVAIFSEMPEDDGKEYGGIPVMHVERIREKPVDIPRIAMICTKKEFVRKVFEHAYEAGIRGIINLTPVVIEDLPEDLRVSQVLLPCEIKLISFLSSKKNPANIKARVVKDAGVKASLKRSRR